MPVDIAILLDLYHGALPQGNMVREERYCNKYGSAENRMRCIVKSLLTKRMVLKLRTKMNACNSNSLCVRYNLYSYSFFHVKQGISLK